MLRSLPSWIKKIKTQSGSLAVSSKYVSSIRRVTVTPRHSAGSVLAPRTTTFFLFIGTLIMGSAQSYVTLEVALTAAVVASAIGIGYTQVNHGSRSSASATAAGGTPAGKKGKKQKSTEALSLQSVSASAESKSRAVPAVIPGGFDTPVSPPTPAVAEPPPPKPKKSKRKKKGKSSTVSTAAAAAPDASSVAGYHSDSSAEHPQPKAKRPQKLSPTSSQLTRTPALQSTISIDTDGSWTRVGSAHRKQHAGAASTSEGPSGPSADPTTSDAGLTTSLTGNSSPVAERTDDEGLNSRGTETRRPLAERLLPKPRKTGVDELRCISCIFLII
jgi:outer membrane biosynthesis protein TonB